MKSVRTLVIADRPLFCNGLAQLLNDVAFIEQIFVEANRAITAQLIAEEQIDLVLMDIQEDFLEDVQIISAISKHFLHLNIIAISKWEKENLTSKLFEAGVKGYICKNTLLEDLVKAIKTVLDGSIFYLGKVYASINQIPWIDDELNRLSGRELEIVHYLALGLSSRQIGEKLFISPFTVKTHRSNIMKKVRAKSTVELVRFAVERNI